MQNINYGDMVRQLMTQAQPVGDVVPFGKRSMYPGMGLEGARGYSGGSGVTPFPAKKSSVPPEIERVYGSYLRGEVKAADVQKVVKERGWFLDMKKRAGPPEIFDPSGRSHDLDY